MLEAEPLQHVQAPRPFNTLQLRDNVPVLPAACQKRSDDGPVLLAHIIQARRVLFSLAAADERNTDEATGGRENDCSKRKEQPGEFPSKVR
jgi:hypothetical protein